ncbi:hypothetical protein F2Q69_00006756 [Brassica cretica]|uniref:Uncharacterized protein n=1 Tax=Brassica cretica TaxID=69181 RepID=A0A8S9P1T6_BRACR|nr:hypothetical protein F2Q69_00006756 [Brassica cretica]
MVGFNNPIPRGIQRQQRGSFGGQSRGELRTTLWREGRRPDSTLTGQDSLEGRCSVKSGFMGVPWKGGWVRPMNGTYQYWKYMIRIDRGVHWRSMAEHNKEWHMI